MERGTHKRLLGEVLVGEGILTEGQLAFALAEQRQTGRPLGEILVTSGVLSGPTLAMALADQSGGPLQTEHGWATGWSRPKPNGTMRVTEAADVEAAVAEPAEPAPVDVAELERELERVKAELEALRSTGPADEADHEDFVIVAAVGDRYVLHLGRGTPPPVGTQLRLPESPEASFVVSRHRPRRFLYLERA